MENDAEKPAGPPPPDLPKPSFMPPPPTPPAPPVGPAPTKFNPPGHTTIQVDRTPSKKVEQEASELEEVEIGAEAGFQTRLFAMLIDLGVMLGLSITVHVLLPASVNGSVSYVFMAAYILLRDALPFLGGRSLGKVAMKLQAVTVEGKSLSGNWATSAIRNLILLFVPVGPLIEAFLLNSRQGGETLRRLGDEFAKTKVIFVGDEPVLVGSKPPEESTETEDAIAETDLSEAADDGDQILDAKVRR